MEKLHRSLHRALVSRWAWRIILGLFIISCLWIAISSQYPMAFDEDFHLGVIKLYSTQLLPILPHLPSSAAAFGAVSQDPSYLFHYLMSFPYRLFASFTQNQTVIVILLRFINIAMVVAALVIFRKALLRGGLGKGSTNVLIAIFTLIPISPLLAAQINYDNLLLLLIACLALQIQPLIKAINAKKLPVKTALLTLILCLTASIVKYAFLPILAGTLLFIGILIYRNFRHEFHKIPKLLATSWRQINKWQRIVLLGLVALLLILGGQRYVVNTIAYHSPIPDCSKMFDEGACSQYGPWKRDHDLEQNKALENIQVNPNPLVYAGSWIYGMWYRLFFTITGYEFQNFPPLPIIGFGAAIIFLAAITIFAASWRRTLRGKPFYTYLLLISAFYCLALWIQNYSAYMRTTEPVAINGRYLLPLLLLAGVPIIAAASHFFARRAKLCAVVIICTIVVFFEGGGLMSYIVRSNEHWYWNNSIVQTTNKSARAIVSPIILGSNESLIIPVP